MNQEKRHKKGLGLPENYLSEAKMNIDEQIKREALTMPSDYLDEAKSAIDGKLDLSKKRRWPWMAAAASVAILASVWFATQPNGGVDSQDIFANVELDFSEDDLDWIDLTEISDESMASLSIFDLQDISANEWEEYFTSEEWDDDELELLLTNNEHL